MNRFEMKIT